VYLISDRDGEFAQLRYVNLFSGEKTVISGRLSSDVEELALSRDGHYLAYVSNEAGMGKLNVLDLRTHQDLIPPKLPGAGIIERLSFDAQGNRLAFATPMSSTSPPIIWKSGPIAKRARSTRRSSSRRDWYGIRPSTGRTERTGKSRSIFTSHRLRVRIRY
jgi:hypothetical protein